MFEVGKVYKRRELHDQFGGNRQGGIANCPKHPFIMIFTAKAGESHGYDDGWDSNNYFLYTGEGQVGDMEFKRGNKSLREHQENGKAVYLFERLAGSGGMWKFIDELELVDYDYKLMQDTNGDNRQGIIFKFKSAAGKSVTKLGQPREAYNINKPKVTERQGLITSRVGQGWYRKCLLEKWGNKCAVTNVDVKEILIASHIRAWKESSPKERLDEENGILLSPNLDALFDKHLITFNQLGEIIISNKISTEQYKKLGVSKNMKLRIMTKGMEKYLRVHREKFNEKN